MKINCQKDVLLKGIQTVQNAVSSKSTLPILSHILIEAKKKEVQDNGKTIADNAEILNVLTGKLLKEIDERTLNINNSSKSWICGLSQN